MATKENKEYPINGLNHCQKEVFDKIVKHLHNSKPQVITLDGPSGTGKSYLIKTLVHNIPLTHKVIVYPQSLVRNYAIQKVNSANVCDFIAKNFQFDNNADVLEMCNRKFADTDTLENCLRAMYENIMDIEIDVDVLILDEYSLISPWLLMCLAHAAKRQGKHFIISGNGDQMNSLHPSKYHGGQSNRDLALALSDHTYYLQEQVIVKDASYCQILDKMHKKFLQCPQTKMTFDILYFLYENFKDMFFQDNVDAVYVSKDDENRKKRHEEILRQWKGKRLQIFYEFFKFRYRIKNPPAKPCNDLPKLYEENSDPNYKETDDEWFNFREKGCIQFPINLPLVLGRIYLYDEQYFVKLMAIAEHSLIVRDCVNGQVISIKRRPIEKCKLQKDFLKLLKSKCQSKGCYNVCSYPLKLPLVTYQSIPFQNVSQQKMVLNINNIDANSVYMALSRLPSSELLAGMKTSLLYSLIYTAEIRNDEYYYKINYPPINQSINKSKTELIIYLKKHVNIFNIQTLEDRKEFENKSTKNWRILRTMYDGGEQEEKKHNPPPLTGVIKISKFFNTYEFLLEKPYLFSKILYYFKKFMTFLESSESNESNNKEQPEKKRAKFK
ncbi:uncharacterized protein [Musca autumnalis]|uniref:uncharacterized protein n=1 Tax=Musca autumnalis TaxID=221902 RepID=UPI003CE6EDD8